MYVPVLLSAAIVEENIHYYTLFNNCNFNLVYRYSLSVKFNSVDYSVTDTRCCSYSCFLLLMMGDSETQNM